MSKTINLLTTRIEENYEDFKAETLAIYDNEDIYNQARHIAAVEDVYHFVTTQSNFVEEGEAAYLLEFNEPLKMLADAWEEYLNDGDQDFRMIVEEVLDRDDNTSNYMTVGLAKKLGKKYGHDMDVKDALLAEALETGKKYMRLKGLLENEGVGLCIEMD